MMRQPLHTELIRFRIDPQLVTLASTRAFGEGMNLSEWLRQAVREKLERQQAA